MRSVLVIAMTVAISAFLAGSASAVNVAGWDFSDTQSDGLPFGTVDANYSSFDPTGGAGAESALYGTATLTGLVGRGGDIQAGVRGSNPNSVYQDANGTIFGNVLRVQAEGQTFSTPMAVTATSGAGTVTFEGDLSNEGAGIGGYGWSISFAGEVVGASSANIGVEFAPDCASYSSVGTVAVDDEANSYTVEFDKIGSVASCARLTIPNSGDERVAVDNVTLDVIAVPEPGVGVQLIAGVAGLVALFRRRA